MRVDEIFNRAKATRVRPVSFEMFPPKGELSLDRAREVASGFRELAPDFVSVTFSAGGSGNSAATAQIARMLTSDFGIPSVAHLTCATKTRAQVSDLVASFRSQGVRNVLALRGDAADGAPQGDYPYAVDLIPELVDAGFCVGAAAYPEGHISCSDDDFDLAYTKRKVDAGASFLVTQLCFENERILRFLDRARDAGIEVPITFGIMPFMSKAQLTRMVFMCGASLPSPIIKLLARYADDADALRAAGIDYACTQLEGLAEAGVDGLHVYTMNRADVATACLSALRA